MYSPALFDYATSRFGLKAVVDRLELGVGGREQLLDLVTELNRDGDADHSDGHEDDDVFGHTLTSLIVMKSGERGSEVAAKFSKRIHRMFSSSWRVIKEIQFRRQSYQAARSTS